MTTTIESPVGQIRLFLTAHTELVGVKFPPINGYNGIADFVLKNGREFLRGEGVPVKRGVMKMCYMNAAHLAAKDSSLTYCEGYATTIIPVLHAWCIDEQGRVVDPTWRFGHGLGYFGVPFKLSFVRKIMRMTKHYGILDTWEHGFPVLKADKKEWEVL